MYICAGCRRRALYGGIGGAALLQHTPQYFSIFLDRCKRLLGICTNLKGMPAGKQGSHASCRLIHTHHAGWFTRIILQKALLDKSDIFLAVEVATVTNALQISYLSQKPALAPLNRHSSIQRSTGNAATGK